MQTEEQGIFLGVGFMIQCLEPREEKNPIIFCKETISYPILGSAPSADNLFRRSSRSPPATSQSIARLIEKGDEVGCSRRGGGALLGGRGNILHIFHWEGRCRVVS